MKPIIDFLRTLPNSPRIIQEWLKIYGTTEIVGPKHNSIIIGWIKALGKAFSWIKDDETPWCAIAQSYVAFKAGKDVSMTTAAARSFLKFGIFVNIKDAMLGDILIFSRKGGNHVGTYVGENKNHFYVFGGNQSNTTNITLISKDRCIGVRRPVYKIQPESVKKYYFDIKGNVSTNEQ